LPKKKTPSANKLNPEPANPNAMNPGRKPPHKGPIRKSTPVEMPKRPAAEVTRLNRYIAQSGICSRREADELIKMGKVRVNNTLVTEMGYQVQPGDKVYYENKLLSKEQYRYVLLNKPKDFITTTDDPDERKTVMQLVSKACPERIYPVGRLDRNTTGVLLLTNDGELSKKLTHPSHEVVKVYQIEINEPITEEDFLKIKDGFELEDGFIKADEIATLDDEGRHLGLQLHSGRNRIVRRIFEELGYEVVKLDRVLFAGLTKRDLPRGKWRFLSEKEVILLKHLK
jgi:23S rRNA pseudouridine2605 synthase